MNSIVPTVKPAGRDDSCEFLWLNAEVGSMVDPYCRGKADVRLDFGEGYEDTRCFGHAVYDLAEILLKQMGTPREEFGWQPPRSLRTFLHMWIRHQLRKEQFAVWS
ncbi:MAG: hypothetical protein Q8P66_01230 [Candidatus Colwellbacteria bacterium]|nr:hypothetical protein [Candidatus Colwellbacteria bacterium]